MTERTFLLTVDQVDETQRKLLHAAVKNESTSWWHEMANVWIFRGEGRARDWVTKLKIITPHMPASMMVVELPQLGLAEWAALGTSTQFNWLMENMSVEGTATSELVNAMPTLGVNQNRPAAVEAPSEKTAPPPN